ncbi:peptide chain release factor N(5)-glutamine methyltransferase [Planosporangium thailandense]|uniref:Release factor glutamine methyltransferase n=1 Tax=Planosporangium thailandense TaxID=765197 RepID=A0ABX0Y4L9_9ACTN|nr:peptide chain release factor N(5)-glutamine methyltransferase [Planosporangium thailandense]NJC73352.1 peptide chain release factor N(5)-glutamine methyltransferase [Planosporangium thailandense]
MEAEQPIDSSRAIREAVAVLSAAGVPSPRVDAEILTAHVLGVPRSKLLLAPALDPARAGRLRELVADRARRVPLQHLTGVAPFHHVDVAVGPGVFVPRPETELLVEWGLSVFDREVVVDLCSGSGAIALAVAAARPAARVYAVERDAAALEWLRRNAESTSVRVVAGDVTDPDLLADLDGAVDLVLCNPPYVPAGTPVPDEVARFDPYPAVFSGPDGLDLIRELVPRVARLLRPGGWFGVEHDDTHGAAVPALLRADGRFDEVSDHRDLAGRPRFATARRAKTAVADYSS